MMRTLSNWYTREWQEKVKRALPREGGPAFTVVTAAMDVLLETDDWVLAQAVAIDRHGDSIRYVKGVHPSHEWPPGSASTADNWDSRGVRKCVKCGAWDNTSYGSQGPCGYNWDASLVAVIEREMAAREAS